MSWRRSVSTGLSFYSPCTPQIGCRYVEVVQPTDTICLWVDEEGLINRSEPNLVASFLAAALGVFGQVLHGTVVVTGGGDEEGTHCP